MDKYIKTVLNELLNGIKENTKAILSLSGIVSELNDEVGELKKRISKLENNNG